LAKLMAALKILIRRLCSGLAMSLREKSWTPQQSMRRMLQTGGAGRHNAQG
jgi:hypothetical protein